MTTFQAAIFPPFAIHFQSILDKRRTYIVMRQQPACATILYVRQGKATILRQGSYEHCDGFAVGFISRPATALLRYEGVFALPPGNAAKIWEEAIASSNL